VVREDPLILLSPDAAKQQAVRVKESYTPEELGLVGPHFKPKIPDEHLTVDDGSLKRQNEALNASGIDSAEIDNSRILSIHTTDGQTILAAEPPFWSWLTLPALPLLGFLIPWGTIRTIIWIKHGFWHKDVKS
jgi:hypothetical protein